VKSAIRTDRSRLPRSQMSLGGDVLTQRSSSLDVSLDEPTKAERGDKTEGGDEDKDGEAEGSVESGDGWGFGRSTMALREACSR